MKLVYENALKRIDRIPPEGLKQIIKNLSAENSIYESALNSTLDGIIVCDLEHKPLFINRSAEKILRIVSWTQEFVLWQQIDDDTLAGFFEHALSSEENILNHELSLSRPSGTKNSFNQYLCADIRRKNCG